MKKILLLNIIFLLFGCSSDKETDKNIVPLSDKLFPIKDIKSTNNPTEDLAKFPELDSAQKVQYITSIMKKEMNLDADYVINYMTARFIAKQSPVLPTILISINGDDYDASFYITLDENDKPISYSRASGGLCAGPTEINDTLLRICAKRYSTFKDSEIKTYVVTETIHLGSVHKPSIFDSVTYQSIILATGEIQTKLKDSIRFTRLTKTN